MKKIFTLELDKEYEALELHLNKTGAEYLKNILEKLISNNKNDHLHLMNHDLGGNELSDEKINLNNNIKYLNQLKIMYWKK